MQKKLLMYSTVAIAMGSFMLHATEQAKVQYNWTLPGNSRLEVIDQNVGLPYTRTARTMAIAKIKDVIALFPGSRYAYIYGKKVRLDNKNWKLEAVQIGSEVYVPIAFAGAFLADNPTFDNPVEYLEKQWTYTVTNPVATPEKLKIKKIDDFEYVSVDALAKMKNFEVCKASENFIVDLFTPAKNENDLGLWIAGKSVDSKNLNEAVVTLFDTPEKFANPDIATKYIPILKRQGKWTEHIKISKSDLALIESEEETKFEEIPLSSFNFDGFDKSALGSKVPAVGIYPRLFLSPEDIPAMRERVKNSKNGQRSLIEMKELFSRSFLNPNTSDGKVFEQLSSDNYKTMKFKDGGTPWHPQGMFEGQTAGIYSSHIDYNINCLTSLIMYAMVIDDEELGKKATTAAVNWYRLKEPFNDMQRTLSDSEFGSSENTCGDGETAWRRQFHPNQQLDLPFVMDLGGYYMTDEQKADMYRIVAKYTYGRRSYAQDAPKRFRDVNWMGWDLSHFLCNATIEGQEGFDQEVYDAGLDSIDGFLQWGVNEDGSIFESNGKSTGSWNCMIQSMTVLARRGVNYFGHPHFRKMLEGQTQVTSPTGELTVNSGTEYTAWRGSPVSVPFVSAYKLFFPNDKYADYLLTNEKKHSIYNGMRNTTAEVNEDLSNYANEVKKIQRLRLPGPGYPGMVNNVLFSSDYKETSREDLNPSLTYIDNNHGVFSAYSDNSDNAMWINLIARPDHYLGAGHHHADCGMFHLSALDVDWITESVFVNRSYNGNVHNLVQIDQVSTPEKMHGRGEFDGGIANKDASFGMSDATKQYTWAWNTQPPQEWTDETDRQKGRTQIFPNPKNTEWTFDDDPALKRIFAGTARYKFRPWWPTYNFTNYMATTKAAYNPVEFAVRSVGLVRGDKPYSIVVDDVKKDNDKHLYQWVASLCGGVWQVNVDGLEPNQIALAFRAPKNLGQFINNRAIKNAPAYTPINGEPILLVTVLDKDAKIQCETIGFEVNEPIFNMPYDRLVIDKKSDEARFKVIFQAFKYGEDMPTITFDSTSAVVNGTDKVIFTPDAKARRTNVKVVRNGNILVNTEDIEKPADPLLRF